MRVLVHLVIGSSVISTRRFLALPSASPLLATGCCSPVLQEYKSTLVTVAGYTNSTGSAEYNQKLSERRASTVAMYLHGRGVVKERLAAIGYGMNVLYCVL